MIKRRTGIVLFGSLMLIAVLSVGWWAAQRVSGKPATVAVVEAETLNTFMDGSEIREDSSASGGAKHIMWDGGVASGTFEAEDDFSQLMVRAKADLGGDEYPVLHVSIDDAMHTIELDRETWSTYVIEGEWSSGSKTVILEYGNDWRYRNVILDVIVMGNEVSSYEFSDSAREHSAASSDDVDISTGEDSGQGDIFFMTDEELIQSERSYKRQPDMNLAPPEPYTPSSADAIQTACLTNGSGGMNENLFHQDFTANGKSGQYHIYGEVVSGRPVGLLVQLHGDGGYEFENYRTYKLPGMAEVARQKNLLMVAVRSPDNEGLRTWYEEGDANAAWLQALLDTEIYAKFPIDKSRVWLSGFSGGAQQISQYYLGQYTDTICGGGAMISGGGTANSYTPGVIKARDEIKQHFAIHFYTGTADRGAENNFDAYAHAQAGAEYYRSQGFEKVTTHFPQGLDHGDLDEVSELANLITSMN